MIEQKRGGRIIGRGTPVMYLFRCSSLSQGASSIAGKKGSGNLSAYSASKFAVRSLTQSAGMVPLL